MTDENPPLEEAHKRALKRVENLIGPLDRFMPEDVGVLTSYLLSSQLHSAFMTGMIQAAIAFYGDRKGPHALAVRLHQIAVLRKAEADTPRPSTITGTKATSVFIDDPDAPQRPKQPL